MKAKIKSFAEINIGDKASFRRLVSEEDLTKFAELSGDYNPLHMDEEYATKTEFGVRVVHGFLLGAWVSRLVGMELPGANALLLKESLAFKKPVRIGDEILIAGEVVCKSQVGQLIELNITINRQQEILVSGSVFVKVLK